MIIRIFFTIKKSFQHQLAQALKRTLPPQIYSLPFNKHWNTSQVHSHSSQFYRLGRVIQGMSVFLYFYKKIELDTKKEVSVLQKLMRSEQLAVAIEKNNKYLSMLTSLDWSGKVMNVQAVYLVQNPIQIFKPPLNSRVEYPSQIEQSLRGVVKQVIGREGKQIFEEVRRCRLKEWREWSERMGPTEDYKF